VVPRVTAANAVTDLPGRGSTLDALIDYPRCPRETAAMWFCSST
jgi:hypothetical protein